MGSALSRRGEREKTQLEHAYVTRSSPACQGGEAGAVVSDCMRARTRVSAEAHRANEAGARRMSARSREVTGGRARSREVTGGHGRSRGGV